MLYSEASAPKHTRIIYLDVLASAHIEFKVQKKNT